MFKLSRYQIAVLCLNVMVNYLTSYRVCNPSPKVGETGNSIVLVSLKSFKYRTLGKIRGVVKLGLVECVRCYFVLVPRYHIDWTHYGVETQSNSITSTGGKPTSILKMSCTGWLGCASQDRSQDLKRQQRHSTCFTFPNLPRI